MPNLGEIKQLIGRSKLKKALQALSALNIEDEENTIIGLQTRLSTLKRQEMGGLINSENAGLEHRRITASILSFISDIEDQIEPEEPVAPAPPKAAAATTPIPVEDQEGLEKVIGKNGLTSITWLTEGVQRAKSVCKIHTPDEDSPNISLGTGFLVEGGYLFTNNHVIPTASAAQFSKIEFGYDEVGIPSVIYELDHSDFITSIAFDYTKVKVKDNPDKPLSQWGILSISNVTPKQQDPLVIIQHPQGRSKEIAFRDGGSSIWEHRLHYEVTTESGSSGSPVFDLNWKVVALHHAGGNLPINANGDRRKVNEGILFQYIVNDLAESNLESAKGAPSIPTVTRGSVSKPINTLLIYHQKDQEYADNLSAHLFTHERNGNLEIFDIHTVVPVGGDRPEKIQQAIDDAVIVMVMISSNLYRKETRDVALAVEDCVQQKEVVPILIKPFNIKGTSFERLQTLPRFKEGSAITDFPDEDDTLMKIAMEMTGVIDALV